VFVEIACAKALEMRAPTLLIFSSTSSQLTAATAYEPADPDDSIRQDHRGNRRRVCKNILIQPNIKARQDEFDASAVGRFDREGNFEAHRSFPSPAVQPASIFAQFRSAIGALSKCAFAGSDLGFGNGFTGYRVYKTS
jgi:hypothetical protein